MVACGNVRFLLPSTEQQVNPGGSSAERSYIPFLHTHAFWGEQVFIVAANATFISRGTEDSVCCCRLLLAPLMCGLCC